MLVLIGLLLVAGSVVGGYLLGGGHLAVLWQPFEFLIIIGGGLGALVCSSDRSVLKGLAGALRRLLRGPRHGKREHLELLCLMYQVFRLAKAKGHLSLEPHIEKPAESTLFQQFPSFHGERAAVEFACDYLRLMLLGADNPLEVEALMDLELETRREEEAAIAGSLQGLADALPALGIVAAVLGVIHTMGAIAEPPEVLGQLVGAALVGTFSGVLAAYGVVGPMVGAYERVIAADGKYLACLKAGILAHLAGSPPAIAVEYARKALLSDRRPSFYEVERAAAALPAPA